MISPPPTFARELCWYISTRAVIFQNMALIHVPVAVNCNCNLGHGFRQQLSRLLHALSFVSHVTCCIILHLQSCTHRISHPHLHLHTLHSFFNARLSTSISPAYIVDELYLEIVATEVGRSIEEKPIQWISFHRQICKQLSKNRRSDTKSKVGRDESKLQFLTSGLLGSDWFWWAVQWIAKKISPNTSFYQDSLDLRQADYLDDLSNI